MQLHELIDREDPRCLYCKSECDIKLDGTGISNSNTLVYNVEILTCRKCEEKFEIYWWDDCDVSSFSFSCKDLAVLSTYDGKLAGLHVAHKKYMWPDYLRQADSVDIPPFNIDFSDKKKLHKKLKTYLLFS